MADIELVIKISEDLYKATINGMTTNDIRDLRLAIANGMPLDKIKAELKDYITYSPYIKSFKDCCCLRDDVMRIIDKYKTENEE